MASPLTGICLTEKLTLNDVAFAGDGGSLFLNLADKNSIEVRVIFYQTSITQNFATPEVPGFLLLNEVKLAVRSDEENAILTALKNLIYGNSIPVDEITSLQKIIGERIAFFESEDYLKVVSKASEYY